MSNLPYEFHVTVKAHERSPEDFRETCSKIGVKAIVLDLGVSNGCELEDYMTSSTAMLDTDSAAMKELQRISDDLADNQLTVVRRKIETAPWHPVAPAEPGDTMPDGSYFEAHLGTLIAIDEVAEFREVLQQHAETTDLHLSRNAFKAAGDGRIVMMATLRRYNGIYSAFAEEVDAARLTIEALGLNLDKPPITEFALFDSNVHHDDEWMRV